MRIDLAQLELGDSFGSGGQGTIHELDSAVACSAGWSAPAVAKIYKRRFPNAALLAFEQRVRWARSLIPETRAELYRSAAWPLIVIEERGLLAGIVLPDARERYGALFSLPSGSTEQLLMSLDHLLSDDGYVERRFGLPCDTRVRAALAERLAAALAVLHKHAIVASDISQANVLVKLREPCSAAFIDCDSMTFQGQSTLPLVETPDWEIPPEWGELANTRAADAYKLGLAVARLFARDRLLRDPGPAETHIPTGLRPLVRAALGARPELRPPAGRWQAALRDVLGTRLTEDFPGPPPRPWRAPEASPRTMATPPGFAAGPAPATPTIATPMPVGTLAGLGPPGPAAAGATAPGPAAGTPLTPRAAAGALPAAGGGTPMAAGAGRRPPPRTPRGGTGWGARRWAGLITTVLVVIAGIVAAQSPSSPSDPSQLGPSVGSSSNGGAHAGSGGRKVVSERGGAHRDVRHHRRHRAYTAVRPNSAGTGRNTTRQTTTTHSSPNAAATPVSPSSDGGASGTPSSGAAPRNTAPPAGLQGGSENAPPAGTGQSGGLEGGSQHERGSEGEEGGLSGGGSR